jgi:hypothetical protein
VGACKYTNAWKNCATCGCWSGERKLDKSAASVTVDSSSVGQCKGFWQGSRKMGNQKCPEWKKWNDMAEWSGEAREVYP